MKTFLNFLKHNRLYTSINLVGLALSMAFILLLAVYVQKQLNTDSFQEKADRIILVANEFYASAYHLQDYLIERYPEIESTTGFLTENNIEIKLREETLYSSVNFADSTFFDIFSFKVGTRNHSAIPATTSLSAKVSPPNISAARMPSEKRSLCPDLMTN